MSRLTWHEDTRVRPPAYRVYGRTDQDGDNLFSITSYRITSRARRYIATDFANPPEARTFYRLREARDWCQSRHDQRDET